MRFQIGGTIAALCVAFSALPGRTLAQQHALERLPSSSASQLLRDLKSSRSPTRGFIVISHDARHNIDLTRWAERAATRVEQLTHLRIPADGRYTTRIVVQRTGTDDNPTVRASQSWRNGTLEQRLTITGYEEVDTERATERLCYLLLSRMCVQKWHAAAAEKLDQPNAGPAPEHVRSIPFWLSLGVARNMGVAKRAEDAANILDRWQQGRLPSLSAFLQIGIVRPAKGTSVPSHDRAVCGGIVAWLSSFTAEDAVFDAVANRLAKGDPLSTDWLHQALPGLGSADEADAAWLDWVRRQRRTVYATSAKAPHVTAQIKAALLLCRGESGMPMDEKLPGRMRLGDLLAYRDEKWIGNVAACKARELRVLAIGRNAPCVKTVEDYCRFLQGLREGTEDRVLRAWLRDADRGLESLTEVASQKK